MIVCLWNRKVEHIARLYISHFLKKRHQFRQVIEPCEPCLCSVSRSFGCEFYRSDSLSKRTCPCVKVLQAVSDKGVVLQIPLDRVKLHHRIADRRSCGEYRSTPSGDLVKVSAFHIEVRAFLRLRLCDTSDITHFRVEEKVFVIMRLIHEDPVYT